METYHIYHSSKQLPETWDGLVVHDIFLQTQYLKALEESTPSNIQLFYVGVFKHEQLVGAAVIQRVQLYLKDMFRKTEVSCAKEFFRNSISKVLKGNILVVGNMMQTGQHGLFFKEDEHSKSDFFSVVFDALEAIKKQIKSTQNKKIRIIMFKDYFIDDEKYQNKSLFKSHELHKVLVQPNMIMPIRENWLQMQDYVADLSKKYRDRYKRALKKLGTITVAELDLEAVETNTKKLHQFYLNVSNNAKFNTFILPENHFYTLKLNLKDNFKVFGYYLDDELIGFCTLILNGKKLETYFLGYNPKYQYANQLYLNMLYEMLKFGIENKFKSVVYARTAMAIKSSVGAKPKAMVVYIKHTNVFVNAALKPIFSLMDPTQDWDERHPFKN